MKPEDLEAVLDAHDVAGCIALFDQATEVERRRLAKAAAARLRATIGDFPARFVPMLDNFPDEHLRQFHPPLAENRGGLRVAQVAVLATATLGELKRLGERGIPPVLDDAAARDVVAVLRARRPPWLREWAEMILSWGIRGRRRLDLRDLWHLVRRLVREGLCERPRGPEYIHAMCLAISDLRRFPDARAAFRDDPGLLEQEIWEVFETEPMPGWRGLYWGVDLAALAGEGRICRDRLLDACLGGLERDFPEERARWFARTHHALQPTLDERAEQAGRHLGLLASRNPSTVVFALRELAALEEAGRVDPRALVEAIGPAMLARTKGMVRDALKLVDRAAGRDPGIRHRAAIAAVDALVHEAPAVQEAALDLIERHGDRADPALTDLLRARVETVTASQRDRILSWLGPQDVEAAADPADAGSDELLARAEALDRRLAERTGVAAAVGDGSTLGCLSSGSSTGPPCLSGATGWTGRWRCSDWPPIRAPGPRPSGRPRR